jgi:hypothetical protein
VAGLENAMEPIEAIRRKLRGLAAMIQDAAVTGHEKENAKALKLRLEKKLRQTGAPAGDWTDIAFRAGQTIQELKNATAPPPSMEGPSKIGFRLGKAVAQARKKLRSS